MTKTLIKRISSVVIVAMFVLVLAPMAHAANFTEVSIRPDRMKASEQNVDFLVVLKPASTATEAKVVVTFPSGYSVDTTASNITSSVLSLPSTYLGESLTALPGAGSAASAVSGQAVTFASDDLTAGTLYGFRITAGVDNHATPGEYEASVATTTSGDVAIDSSNLALRIISEDQVTVTATVPPTFNFSIDNTSVVFDSDLSSSSVVSSSGSNDASITVATNAANGWTVWLSSAFQGLLSATTSEGILTVGTVEGTPTSLSAGTNGFVLDVDETTDSGTGDGDVTIAAEYNGADTSSGGTLSSSLTEIATADGTTDGDVITLVPRAAISAVVSAADDYTDTWTVVGAGNF